ncbi:hypothetical protein [Weizmannia sp. CD-2023]|uniref:hypothetical protein n=1 Tax=Weizmannia sp. CD-2023 TaxID=3037263 RepID=UPI002E1F87DF|nr:hypothetical protein [Weizmannia sp. CD-2023]
MIKYLWLSLKMQFRIPFSIFFALVFPLLMMIIMIASYGNFPIGNGYHFIDKYFLISTGIGLVPIFMISYPIWIAESIQNNSYRRLSYLGVEVKKMVVSDILSYLVLTLINVSLNIVVALCPQPCLMSLSQGVLTFILAGDILKKSRQLY